MNEVLDWVLATVREIDPALRAIIAMVGMFLETSILIGMVIPGDTIALLAAAGVTTSTEFIWLMIALILGALAGESVGFLIGRYFGPRLRASRLGKRIGEKNWMLADLYLGDKGGLAVFVSRFLPVLHSVVPITAGMTRMRYRSFIAWTAAATIVWSTIYVSFGYFAALSYEQLSSTVKFAGYIIVGIVLIAVLSLWLLKKFIFKREISHLEETVDARQPKNNRSTDGL